MAYESKGQRRKKRVAMQVAVQPSCVKAPIEIIIHHIVTALYITVTWVQPSFSKLMCYNLLVEINTFFLILKRHIKSPILEFGFYLTWVTMRCA